MPSIPYPLMNTRDDLTCSISSPTATFLSRKFSLGFGKSRFVLPKEAGIRDGCAVGESGEMGQSHINADLFGGGGQRMFAHLTGENGVPLVAAPSNH